MRDSRVDDSWGHSFPDVNPNPVFEANFDSKVVYSNPAARAVLGDFESLPWLRDTVGQFVDGKRDKTTLTVKVGISWFQFTTFFVENLQLIRFYGTDVTELKQVQKSKENSVAELDATVSSLAVGLIVYNLDGKAVRMNEAAEKTLPKELFYKTTVDDRNRILHWIRENGEPFPTEEIPIHRALNGETVLDVILGTTIDDRNLWINTSAAPILSPDYKMFGAVASFVDISKQKEVERKLVGSEARLRLVLDSSLDCVYRVNLQTGRYEYISKSAEKIIGFSADELMAQDLKTASSAEGKGTVHPDDLAAMKAGFARSEEDGEATVEYRQQTKSSEYRWISNHVSVVRDNTGSPLYRDGVVRDITDRKRMEEIRDSKSAELDAVVHSLAVGLVIYDSTGKATFMNSDAEEMLHKENFYNLTAEERQRVEQWKDENGQLIPVENLPISRALRGETLRNAHYCVFRSGRIVWLSISAAPIITARHTMDGAVASLIDVTEQKQAEQEKAVVQAQLAQAQKIETIGQLAGGVAHDFNNMLQVIISYADMSLSKVETGTPLHKYLSEIHRAASRSAEITRQLLAFARKQAISPKVLDLNEAVTGTQRMIQRLIGEDIDLSWSFGRNLWKVKIDPAQLDQVLANLAVNARDAIGGVGKLTVETANVTFDAEYCALHYGFQQGEYVLLAVSDNGRGMDKETMSHLFEPFFTTKSPGEGTGLGLATIFGIVKQNNGFINVYSEQGEGTTFKVYLPRVEGAITAERPESQTTASRGGTETLLVVEDEAGILELVSESLGQLGYTVLAARSPEEALRKSEMRAGPIHLLITDVVMPQMNGRQLSQRLGAVRPGLKCLYMSGYTANVIAHRGVLEEGVSFIAKPFSIRDLCDKIRETLDGEWLER